MKKKLLLLVCSLICLPLLTFSKEVNISQAQEVAKSVLPGCYYMSSTGFYHLFGGKSDGWILIAANDVIEPVIAYSEDGNFDTNAIPPAFEWILDGVRNEIERRIVNNILPDQDIKDAWKNNNLKSAQAVAPLLTTAWDQLSPYNAQCPLFNNNPSYTGCVATAMAQIMNYHKYPATGKKNIPSYLSAGTLRVPEITLDDMVYTWETGEKEPVTDEEKNQVAKLIFHAGASVRMTYSSQTSNATALDARAALMDYFDYDASMHSKFKVYYTEQEWRQLIIKELDERRPVLCNGTSDSNAGHAFVCDGYNAQGFHFNWGWGPGYLTNTYVSFSAMQYRNGVSVLLGIQPNKGLDTFYEFYIFHMGTIYPGLQVSKEQVNVEEEFTVDYILQNTGSIDFKGKQGAVLVKENADDEEIVAVLGFNENVEVRSTEMKRFNTTFDCTVPASVKSGDYWVQAAVLPEDSEEWIYVNHGNDKVNRMALKVNNPDDYTGVDNIRNEHVNVFWNKETSSIDICGQEARESISFELINTRGQIVLQRNQVSLPQQIKGRDLEKGVYLYRMSDAANVWQMGKLVIP